MNRPLSLLLVLAACSDTGPTTGSDTQRPTAAAGSETPRVGSGTSGGASNSGGVAPSGATDAGGVGQPGTPGTALDSGKPGTPSTFAVGTRWHIDLENPVDTTVNAEAFDIDLFDNVSTTTIASLHARGRKVICYFSAGSSEAARPDFTKLPKESIGLKMDGWPENWLDHRNAGVRSVMASRIELAQRLGCDGVDPDNVDGYSNQTGFPLSAKDQLEFNRFLAGEAHARGLAVGLKNDLDQIPELLTQFDFAINEQCFAFNECAKVDAFVAANKSVANIEYGSVVEHQKSVCPSANARSFFTILSEKNAMDGTYTRCKT
jgi:hypothetical protein